MEKNKILKELNMIKNYINSMSTTLNSRHDIYKFVGHETNSDEAIFDNLSEDIQNTCDNLTRIINDVELEKFSPMRLINNNEQNNNIIAR